MKGLKRKGKLLFPLLAVFAGLFLYLLLPLSSKEWNFEFDKKMIASKREFLDRIRGGTSSTYHSQSEAPPNILLITADDLGKTDISLYGGETVQTPNIDAIGAEGVTFTDAYCSSPICSPSRAGMLTGRYQQRFGMEVQPQNRYARNRLEYFVVKHFIDTGQWFLVEFGSTPKKSAIEKQGLPPSEITLGELLKSAGYRTGITGKWHLGFHEEFIPNNRGFDDQYGFYEAFSLYAPAGSPGIVEYRHDYYANKHIWKQERTGSCAVRRNHEVIEEPEYLTFRIAEEANRFLEENREEPFFLYVPFSAPHTPFQAPEEYCDRFSHVEDKNKQVYYGMIAALDDAVGMIMEKLSKLGLDENTLVMFASDNGGATYTDATENAPLKGGKFMNFEGGINVPAMVRWKGTLPGGTAYSPMVSLLDFFSTAAGAAGVPLPEDRVIDGKNLLPYLRGGNGKPTRETKPHRALFWRAAYNKAVRSGPWKLIIDEKKGRELLYNLENDKVEKRNLAARRPDVVDRLKAMLEEWEKGLMGPLWPRVMDFRVEIDGEEYEFAL